MALFHNQPASHRFGTELMKELEQGSWRTFEVGVAWVRRSGMQHILPALHAFLRRGGVLRIAVGIDIQNTSKEGLEDLLALPQSGVAEIFVYHDEASTTFHPKVYLFYNDHSAKLIVCSNNITESGLFVNTEAGLEIDAPITEAVIQDSIAGLASWRDSSQGFALSLDANLLRDLVDQGYVLSESALPRPNRNRKAGIGGSAGSKALFGRSKISRPPVPTKIIPTSPGITPVSPSAATPGVGEVLIMRVRKAHKSDRPTQTQVPKKVFESPFFAGITSITSAHDGKSHKVITASARGIINTLKLEIPEMRDFDDPVVRLERTVSGIIYQAFDSNSVLGRPILAALERGLSMSPPATNLTKPSSPETSTWWRYI